MAPQKGTMVKKKWVKVGQVILKKPHAMQSVGVPLASQMLSTDGGSIQHQQTNLPRATGRYMITPNVNHTSIQDDFKGGNNSTNKELLNELNQVMQEMHNRTLMMSMLNEQQKALLAHYSKLWEEYLKNCELHA